MARSSSSERRFAVSARQHAVSAEWLAQAPPFARARACTVPSRRQSEAPERQSERYLGTHGDGIDARARRGRPVRRQLIYVVVNVIEHEADVVVDIPVDAQGKTVRAAAEHAPRGSLREARRRMAVEVDMGPAHSHFP